MIRRHLGAHLTCLAAGLLLMAGSVHAGPITGDPPTLVAVLESNGIPAEYAPAVEEFEVDDNKYKLKGSKDPVDIGGVLWTVEEIEFDPDPFVLANNVFTNPTAVPQIVTFGIALPTNFPAPNRIKGLIDLDVIDGGTDGASVSTVAGFPIYTAEIDFVGVETLLDAPFTLNAPATGSNNATDSFGFQVSNVPVNASIGIQLRFQLSPGDTATVISRFDVVEIPEPTTCLLFVAGLAGCLTVRRRG